MTSVVTCQLHAGYMQTTDTTTSFIACYKITSSPSSFCSYMPVTCGLHTLCPKWNISFVASTLALRLFFFYFARIQRIFYDAGCHRIVLFLYPKPLPKRQISHFVVSDIFQTGVLIASVDAFLPVKLSIFTVSK